MWELTRAIQASQKERVKQAEMITGHLYFADGFRLALSRIWLLQLPEEKASSFWTETHLKKRQSWENTWSCMSLAGQFDESGAEWIRNATAACWEGFVSTVLQGEARTDSSSTADQSQMILSWLNFKIVILYFAEIEGVLYQNEFIIYLLKHGDLKDLV